MCQGLYDIFKSQFHSEKKPTNSIVYKPGKSRGGRRRPMKVFYIHILLTKETRKYTYAYVTDLYSIQYNKEKSFSPSKDEGGHHM